MTATRPKIGANWPVEAMEILREMKEGGASCSKISEALVAKGHNLTTNACIGMAHRLGIVAIRDTYVHARGDRKRKIANVSDVALLRNIKSKKSREQDGDVLEIPAFLKEGVGVKKVTNIHVGSLTMKHQLPPNPKNGGKLTPASRRTTIKEQPREVLDVPAVVESPQPKTWDELDMSRHCQWALGTLLEKPTSFCGNPIFKSGMLQRDWCCAGHFRIGYNPPQARRRAA